MSVGDLLLEAERRGCMDLAIRIVAELGTERDMPPEDAEERIAALLKKGKKHAPSQSEACPSSSTDAAAGYGCATKED